jgi:epoxyqueuosine reductase
VERSAATQRVRQLARDAGFALAGIATLRPAATGDAYRRWLERGDQAGMEWMSRNVELRLDPRTLLAGARSALVVGLPYRPTEEPGGDLWPKVARYARGRDYHDLLRERLGCVAEAIAVEFPGAATRICVDTAPLLERELAARAGLGAIGKNTLLIHPEAGSEILLGELLTSLDLVPDTPVADLCGACSRCLDACPTGALAEPYRLDAERCLSYWTIEHRGELPEEIAPHLADHVFGCDDCQRACPWNAGDGPVAEDALGVPPMRADLDLVGLLELGIDGYRERFRGSAMKRAKREGLRRNAALALAGVDDVRSADALRRAARDDSPVVRSAAAWAARRRGLGD